MVRQAHHERTSESTVKPMLMTYLDPFPNNHPGFPLGKGGRSPTDANSLQVAHWQLDGWTFTLSGVPADVDELLRPGLIFRFFRKVSVQFWQVQYAGCLPESLKLRSSSLLGMVESPGFVSFQLDENSGWIPALR
ncbi:MAG: hypothetical protein F4X65_03590 [Chloroflexi bacterium]|nr:hypothetical protein [Chloroflexota bacterium]